MLIECVTEITQSFRTAHFCLMFLTFLLDFCWLIYGLNQSTLLHIHRNFSDANQNAAIRLEEWC